METVERHPGLTLEGLLTKLKLGEWFRRYYLLPMGGAIWSCPLSQMLEFPARTFVRFFQNHGLLTLTGQPQWYTVTGGAQEYVRRLIAPFAHRIRTSCDAAAITRADGKVQVRDARGSTETYDEVVLACHGDEARTLLQDASRAETEALAPFRYILSLVGDCSLHQIEGRLDVGELALAVHVRIGDLGEQHLIHLGTGPVAGGDRCLEQNAFD